MSNVIWLKRFPGTLQGGLFPYEADGQADVFDLPFNKPLRADLWQPRNPEASRRYWAIVSRVARGIGKDKEDVDRKLRVLAGHCDVFFTENFGEVRVAKSIQEKECDEAAFQAYFDTAIPFLYTEFGLDHKAVDDILKGRPRR